MSIKRSKFFTCEEGRAQLYELRNVSGFGADISDFGGVIYSLFAPEESGKLVDVVLGYNDLENYSRSISYLGAFVGRCANRITGGKFSIDGREYELSCNIPGASLHGGYKGFSHHLHQAETRETPEGPALILRRLSPDGEEGYPGNLQVEVIYTVTNDNSLKLEYRAVTDAPTIVNLTNHSYFNLNGTGCDNINNHKIWINAAHYTPTDKNLIPNGKIEPVAGTILDLSKSKMMEECLAELPEGFDHNYMLNSQCRTLRDPAAVVSSAGTGIVMK
ncbi:MAG: galactose mutarotase, partial [Victivallales bacterium]|nr:galactose mutarotase [Victivallales bacterium]